VWVFMLMQRHASQTSDGSERKHMPVQEGVQT
jgi:hypothetical protein